VVLGPYLQSVTDHSVIIAWQIDQPRDGQVAYGEAGSLRSRAVDRPASVDHAITLEGLKPYTLYSYRIESGGVPISAEYSFRTAPDNTQTEFSFVAFGDTRSQHSVHQAVAARIEMLEPDFVIHTGDLVDDGRHLDQWETFFKIEQAVLSRAPFFPAMGNHEEDADHYFDLFHLTGNERWYSLTYGSALFIFLQIDGYGLYDSESEQYAWLQRTLESNALPWVFIAFHIPPFSSLREEALEVSIRKTLTPLFERHGVDIVFNGHHHDYQRAIVNGVTYVITGGGGAPIYNVTRTDAHLIAHKNAYHVLYVKVSGDQMTAVGVTPEGEEFDRFSITERGSEGSR